MMMDQTAKAARNTAVSKIMSLLARRERNGAGDEESGGNDI